MISVPFNPDTLTGTQALEWSKLERKLTRATVAVVKNFRLDNPSVYTNKGLNSDLNKWLAKNVFAGKCAYCETKLEKIPDLEHYRPKHSPVPATTTDHLNQQIPHPGYFWLAFNRENLLPSCHPCNEEKGREFPVTKTHVYLWRANPTKLTKPVPSPYSGFYYLDPKDLDQLENPLLLNPYRDQPRSHLVFDLHGKVQHLTQRGKRTIEVLELNRLAPFRREAAVNLAYKLAYEVAAKVAARIPEDRLKLSEAIEREVKRVAPNPRELEFSAAVEDFLYITFDLARDCVRRHFRG